MYRNSTIVKTAMFWHGRDDGKIACDLCPHGCILGEGGSGLCRVRIVDGGELRAAGYGLVSSAALDPIEKKPLYHFRPGTEIFSVGGWGCNFACPFCQNWTISQQVVRESGRHDPAAVAARAGGGGSIGVAYTYNEPLVGFEFVVDCCEQVAAGGLANVLVTNGYIRSIPAAKLLPLVSALNVDIKSMDEAFYRKQCRASLGPVLEFAVQAREAGSHLEITNLLIPGLNDDSAAVEKLASWISESLGPETPLHLSAYRPQYKMTNPPTPAASLRRAHDICAEQLSHVYLGNVVSDVGRDTVCASCGSLLIERRGYATRVTGMDGGSCARCGVAVHGVF